jgi:uncharacterized protein
MKFTQDNSAAAHAVTARTPGEVRIGERVLRSSVVVSADVLDDAWPVRSVAQLEGSLETIFSLQPEILILGTGETQHFPEPAVYAAVVARGIGFEVMDNGAACRTYNVLLAEGRRVALALIL